MPMDEVREIRIVVKSSGAPEFKRIADGLGGINRAAKDVTSSMSFFKNAAIGAFAALRVRDLVTLSDSMQQLFDRISVLSGGTEKAKEVFEKLGDVANRTKTSIDQTAIVYARVAASTKELGLSTGNAIQLTELLQNTFRLSGSTAEEAANGTVQFTQALALGVLRGQDFKSVLSQNVVFGDILTKTLGKTRGELAKMAEEGKLTNKVVLPALWKAMGDVNSQASKLSSTFGQTLTISMNNFKLKVLEINKELDLSGKFASGVQLAIDNWKSFALVLSVIVLTRIPAFLNQLGTLSAAMVSFATKNPLLLALLAISTALIALKLNMGNIQEKSGLDTFFDDVAVGILRTKKEFAELIIKTTEYFDVNKRGNEVNRELIKSYQDRINIIREMSKEEDDARASGFVERLRKKYESISKDKALQMKDQADQPETIRARLISDLNKAYDAGTVSVGSYYRQLEALDSKLDANKFKTGKIDLEQRLNLEDKLAKAEINRTFTQATTSLKEFNSAVSGNKIKGLNDDLEAGKISLLEYDAALIKVSENFEANSAFRTGTNDYLKSIGTTSSQVAAMITGAFSHLEDSFVEMTKTGKINFRDFAQAVLDDLNKIIIRSTIIAPLARGLLDFSFAGAEASTGSSGFQSPSGGMMLSAKGNIFDGPTLHGFGNGKLGMLGESGPEAVIPLTRNGSGELGIKSATPKVSVNIINNSGGQVEQTESTGPEGERQIEILIHGKIKEGIASGKFDRTFQQAYGITRRGN